MSNPWQTVSDQDWWYSGSEDKDVNFYNWNRYFFIYCDGTGHQGYLKDPITIKGKDIYFRGLNNTETHLAFVFSLLPPELTDTFVVYGCSAGGLATFTWVQTIADFIHSKNPQAKVIGLPDAGFFIDYPTLITGTNDYARNIQAVVDLVNSPAVPLPNARCMANETAAPHHCMMAEHLLSYIEVPLFISESLYDIWQLANILQVACMDTRVWPPGPISTCNSSEMVEINKFKDYTIAKLNHAFDMQPTQRGIWAPACPYHCYSRFGLASDPDSSNYTVPALS